MCIHSLQTADLYNKMYEEDGHNLRILAITVPGKPSLYFGWPCDPLDVNDIELAIAQLKEWHKYSFGGGDYELVADEVNAVRAQFGMRPVEKHGLRDIAPMGVPSVGDVNFGDRIITMSEAKRLGLPLREYVIEHEYVHQSA